MKPVDEASLAGMVRGPLRLALVLALVFFVGFGGWSSNAPLSSAAVAPGFVGVEAQRKRVQHLEGGIITDIRVGEGDRVEANALLVRLDKTIASSTYDLLEGQFIDLLAEEARLLAERDKRETIAAPDLFANVENRARAENAMAAQRALFVTRRDTLRNRIGILAQQIGQLEEQLQGFAAQEAASRRQLKIIKREEAAVAKMVRQGLEREPRLLALQRSMAEIEGFLGEIVSRRAQSQLRIGEIELEIVDLKGRTINQITGDLREITSRIADMEPRLRAARGTLGRTEVRAPVAGTVVALQKHTIGGVIQPGGWILDIVPANADLLIEAQVSPADIDVVRPGLTAEIRLTAFAQRTTPTLPGKVVHVSADRLTDRATQKHYYAIYIQLNADARGKTTKELVGKLYPGMPVEVMVVTGERTALDYMTQPVVDSFARAFRE